MFETIVSQIRDESALQFWAIAGVAVAAAAVGYWLWSRSADLLQLLHDTPTSKCAFAKTGYVELAGTQHQMSGVPITAPLSGVSCTWWQFSVEQRHQKIESHNRPGEMHVHETWSTLRTGVSKAPFVVRDETGEVVIDPNGADVTPSVVETWYGDNSGPIPPPASGLSEGPYRFTERLMCDGNPIFATGTFKTLKGKFPLRVDAVVLAEGTHLLSRPSDERPFILSVWPQGEIAGLRQFSVLGGLMLFYGGSVVAFVLILVRLLA